MFTAALLAIDPTEKHSEELTEECKSKSVLYLHNGNKNELTTNTTTESQKCNIETKKPGMKESMLYDSIYIQLKISTYNKEIL